MGEKQYGIDEKRLAEYAEQIKEIHEQGIQIGIVIAGKRAKYRKVAEGVAKNPHN